MGEGCYSNDVGRQIIYFILAIGSMVAGASRFEKGGAVVAWRMGHTIVHAGPRPNGSFRDRMPVSTCVKLG